MKFKTEQELCERFIEEHPRREQLYFEVHLPGGRADIIHMENSIVTIYEAKLRLSIELLEQCINRKQYAHFVYAVVPSYKRKTFLEQLYQDYGIGVLSLAIDSSTYRRHYEMLSFRELATPLFNRRPHKITLYEENKSEVAGVQSGGVTPFAIMVKNIKKTLNERGTMKFDELFKHQNYYGAPKQFKTNIYQWIRAGVIKGIEMEKGMLWLSSENKKEEAI